MDTTKNSKARFKRPVELHHKLLESFIYLYIREKERERDNMIAQIIYFHVAHTHILLASSINLKRPRKKRISIEKDSSVDTRWLLSFQTWYC